MTKTISISPHACTASAHTLRSRRLYLAWQEARRSFAHHPRQLYHDGVELECSKSSPTTSASHMMCCLVMTSSFALAYGTWHTGHGTRHTAFCLTARGHSASAHTLRLAAVSKWVSVARGQPLDVRLRKASSPTYSFHFQ